MKQRLTSVLPLEAESVQLLVEEILAARSDPAQNAIVDFLSLGQGAEPADRVPDFVRLHKIALIFGHFKATAKEISHIAEHGADFGGFNLSSMPLDRTDAQAVDDNAASLFAQWEHLRAFFALRPRLPQADLSLLDVMAATSAVAAQAKLSALSGWDAGDVELLSSAADGIGVPDAAPPCQYG